MLARDDASLTAGRRWGMGAPPLGISLLNTTQSAPSAVTNISLLFPLAGRAPTPPMPAEPVSPLLYCTEYPRIGSDPHR